jgi:hypothetical protein
MAVPGLLEPGNIDLHRRPVVRNRDGSISTVRSMSVEMDGKEILIPTVAADGSRILSDRDAVEQYRRTGQHLGIFRDEQSATDYAQRLHQEQAREYSPMADNSPSKVTGKTAAAKKPFTAFEQAFLTARKAGLKTFQFRGQDYTTKLKSEALRIEPPTSKPTSTMGLPGLTHQPEPKPSAGDDTRNQSPPGPQDRQGGLYAGMTNPPERQPDQPTPQDVAEEDAARQAIPAGGALGMQGPGNPAAAPPQMAPQAAMAPPGGPSAPGPLPGPAAPPGGPPTAPGGPPTAPGGPPMAQGGPPGGGGQGDPSFDAAIARLQQQQAGAMQGQLSAVPTGPQAAPPSDPNAPQTMDQGGGAIDWSGLANYFYELGRKSVADVANSAGGRLVRNATDSRNIGGSR